MQARILRCALKNKISIPGWTSASRFIYAWSVVKSLPLCSKCYFIGMASGHVWELQHCSIYHSWIMQLQKCPRKITTLPWRSLRLHFVNSSFLLRNSRRNERHNKLLFVRLLYGNMFDGNYSWVYSSFREMVNNDLESILDKWLYSALLEVTLPSRCKLIMCVKSIGCIKLTKTIFHLLQSLSFFHGKLYPS